MGVSKKELREIEHLARVLTLEQIAHYKGLLVSDFEALMQQEPKIETHYYRGLATGIAETGESLLSKASKGNFFAQQFYLEAKGGWRTAGEVEEKKATAPIQLRYSDMNL